MGFSVPALLHFTEMRPFLWLGGVTSHIEDYIRAPMVQPNDRSQGPIDLISEPRASGGMHMHTPPAKRMKRDESDMPLPTLENQHTYVSVHAELEPAFTRRLQNVGVDDYRRNYRRFRIGKPEGAKGEIPQLEKGASVVGLPLTEAELEDIFEFEVEENHLYQDINRFRNLYRRYRMGYARGAKGDVAALSSQLTVAHARMVPVAQLSKFLAKLHVVHKATTKSSFHLHLGAGRLGLGLVIPALVRSGVPFAMLQRPSRTWSPLLQDGVNTAKLYVNGEAYGDELVVVRDLTSLPPSEPVQQSMLVLSDDPLLLHLLVSTATSFSISLGGVMLDVVLPLLSTLPLQQPGGKRPALYAAENDHKMVDELAKALDGRVEVIPCMVDRICTDRVIDHGKLEVLAEPFDGEMVIMQAADNGLAPPFEGELIRQPAMEAQANYFCRRKFLLVNGTHTTLAFMTLCMNQKDKEGPLGEYQLIDWRRETCGEKYHKEIWAWAVARLTMLLWEHELPVLHHAHGTKTDDELCDQLLEYTTRTLQRFSSIKDTTSRVLKGGVANRWETRLNVTNTFMQSFKLTPVTSILLRKAELKLPYIQAVVRELCGESHVFTGLAVSNPKVVCT